MGERREGEGEKMRGGERRGEWACVFSLLSNEKSFSAINIEQKKAKQRERNFTAPPGGRHSL